MIGKINIKGAVEKLGAGLHMSERGIQLSLTILIIVLINIAGLTCNFRFDLTRNGTYSLSKKSKEVVSGLKEKLKIRVLFSHDLPAQHTAVYRYLQDIMEEYDYYGNRYFSYEIVDEDDLEKQAADFGIKPVQSQEYANDQIRVRKTYMGLVIQQADLIEKLPTVTDTTGLEYDITSLIEKMSSKIDGLLKLEKPISLRLYLDSSLKNLPIDGIDRLGNQVREAVDKSNVRNYNKIHYDLIDPSAGDGTGAVNEIVMKYGLKKLKWGAGKTRSGKMMNAGEAVFGIVLETGEKFRTMELNVAPSLFGNYVIQGTANLDDRINDAVSSLVSSNPKVGYITGHGEVSLDESQSQDNGEMFKKILSDVYDLQTVDLTKDEIPADIGAIIINGPKSVFSEYELFKIDQFLMKGKSAVFFVDSFNEIQIPGQNNMFSQQPTVMPVNTGVEKLLQYYGITVNRDIILDANCTKVNLGQMIKDYPLVPIIREEGLSKESTITKYLKGLAVIKASSISIDDKRLKEKGARSLNLVSSSDESWLMTGRINFNPMFMDADRNAAKDMKSYSLAVSVSGKLDSYFKNRPVPEKETKGDENKTAGKISAVQKFDRTIEAGDSTIVAVSTSEITRSSFIMSARRILSGTGPRGKDDVFSNSLFLHNIIDNLAGNNYIPEMRSKSLDYNPLDKVSDAGKLVWKILNWVGLPLLIVAAGLFIWRRRAIRKNRLMKEFAEEGK